MEQLIGTEMASEITSGSGTPVGIFRYSVQLKIGCTVWLLACNFQILRMRNAISRLCKLCGMHNYSSSHKEMFSQQNLMLSESVIPVLARLADMEAVVTHSHFCWVPPL